MPATIIMGGQWGDEGKGKLTDALANNADVVVRANGGSNAGHTVTTSAGTFKLHLVPSGILHENCLSVIGAGVVLEPGVLVRELDDLVSRSVDLSRLRISDRAHVVMPFHPVLDELEEESRGREQIGTTRRGIGPAYADKASRRGIRVADLMDTQGLRSRVERELANKNRMITTIYGGDPFELEPILDDLLALSERLRPYVVPAEMLVQDALASGQKVIVEAAQGALLDIDYGTYPFVTSSSPTAAGACQGAGVAPTQVERVIGVYKAYSTRVGAGPFPTELFDATGDLIRERGHEYGTTTGRPRRIGWFDAVASRYSARLNGVTEVCLTLVDVLDALPEIAFCTAYELDGQPLSHLPARDADAERITPLYETVAGWNQDITRALDVSDLPGNARVYIAKVEQRLGVPVTQVGVGPLREQLVSREPGDGATTAESVAARIA